MMRTILPHKHLRRCFATVRDKESGEGKMKLICKVPDNYKLNPSPSEHSFVPIPIEHSQEAIHVMQTIGVAAPPSPQHKAGEQLHFEPLVECLEAKKHIPPAHGNEGIISPVPGSLMARNPNTSNIQFTTGYTLSRYLAKYVVSIDVYNVLRICPPRPRENQDTFHV